MSFLAFSAARMEFIYGQIGQSVGIDMAQAMNNGNQALQDVDYPTLRAAILAAGDTATTVLPQVK